ncbi:MAG: hypothetical protein MAG715_00682 [Methanonatronarchaeales archaeon]|nr:hypothetical protein [Methanonatronarchaeales archaeon]
MRGEAVRTEGRALGPLSDDDLRVVVEEVLDTYGLTDEVHVVLSGELGEDEPEPDSLVIHPERAPLSLRRRVLEPGAALWDVDDVVREVGRAALVQLGAEFELEFGTDEETVLSSPVNVDSEEALDIARPYVKDAAIALLEMVPHVLYGYSCRRVVGDGEIEEEFDESGTVALDLVSGELSGTEFDDVVDLPVSRAGELVQPSVEPAEADERARRLLSEEMSREVRLETEKRQTRVYETRRVSPPIDSVELDEGDLVYRGIWTVKGGRTDVVVDSATGEILSPNTGGGVELV